jgi:hypothetical protein
VRARWLTRRSSYCNRDDDTVSLGQPGLLGRHQHGLEMVPHLIVGVDRRRHGGHGSRAGPQPDVGGRARVSSGGRAQRDWCHAPDPAYRGPCLQDSRRPSTVCWRVVSLQVASGASSS